MIPYLLWLCHRGNGSISKYGIRSQMKSCKMNTSHCGHEESIKKYVLLSGVMSFVLSWSAHHQRHEDAVPDGGAGTWVVHPILSLDHVIEINEYWWNQRSLWQKAWKSMQIKPMPLHLFMSLLWLMWWTFCEIKWFESSFKCPYMCVCLFVVCLCTRLFESMLMFMLECMTTKEILGNSFINTEKKNWVTYQTWVILQLFNFDLTPHFKALHLHVSHNHNK